MENSEKLTHAYIYTGASHDDLLKEARELACNLCKTSEESHFSADIIEVTNARYNLKETLALSVDAVRAAIEELYLRPYGDHKVLIFPHADQMTLQAANALLKSLEEPPAYAIFILLAENESAMLPTVRSRAQTKRVRAQASGEEIPETADLIPLLEALTTLDASAPYRLIEFFQTNKANYKVVFCEMAKYFHKKMLLNCEKDVKINKDNFVRAAIWIVENAEKALAAIASNANYNMTVTVFVLNAKERLGLIT